MPLRVHALRERQQQSGVLVGKTEHRSWDGTSMGMVLPLLGAGTVKRLCSCSNSTGKSLPFFTVFANLSHSSRVNWSRSRWHGLP